MHFVCFVVNPTNIFYPKKFLHRNMIILCRISVIYDIRLFNKFLNCLIRPSPAMYLIWKDTKPGFSYFVLKTREQG